MPAVFARMKWSEYLLGHWKREAVIVRFYLLRGELPRGRSQLWRSITKRWS